MDTPENPPITTPPSSTPPVAIPPYKDAHPHPQRLGLLLVLLFLAVIAFGIIFVRQIKEQSAEVQPPVLQQPAAEVTQEEEDISSVEAELEESEPEDIDKDFEAIDEELNSLDPSPTPRSTTR